MPVILQLQQRWTTGARIGGGGFGSVFEVQSDSGASAVAKLVPKDPGADRELLFVDLAGARNIVPVIDSGEHENNWVLVMPRAELSLAEFINRARGPLSLDEALPILVDICDALVSIEGAGVVHRDIKPANILFLDGRWCLADFGISRYAEQTTAEDTRKYSFTPAYAAPEQWRYERATASTDAYAFGVVAYELLAGSRPFIGSSDELREMHLHGTAPSLTGVGASAASVIDECLFKSSEARPSPANLRRRLDLIARAPKSPGLAALISANRAQVARDADEARRRSEERTEAERREALFESATRMLRVISESLLEAIEAAAPVAKLTGKREGGPWTMQLGEGTLAFGEPRSAARHTDPHRTTIDVVGFTTISVTATRAQRDYRGRGHSLWYCDAVNEGEYQWFETAFMSNAFARQIDDTAPFSLEPHQGREALGHAIGNMQIAWPFEPLVSGELDDFVDRWAGWLSRASQGELTRPHQMPERNAGRSWRR